MDRKTPPIPSSRIQARRLLRTSLSAVPEVLTTEEFTITWSAIAYMYPGLHPDGLFDEECGWPPALRPFAEEAWRRFDAGAISTEELYPSEAQWAGVYDRMLVHTADESSRREALRLA